jgi:dipeptidyl aminopeptidase/acylaminoacyl peptidase
MCEEVRLHNTQPMNSSFTSYRALRWLIGCLVAGSLVLAVSDARADNVDTQIASLKDKSEKVRLSAVLSLSKLADDRAIAPLIAALGNDTDRNVRATTAVTLAKLVSAKTKPASRSQIVAALKKAKSDSEVIVKTAAEKALVIVGDDAPETGTGTVTKGGVYIEIGPMASKATDTKNDYKAVMRKTSQKTLGSVAKDMMLSWSGGKSPTKSQLDQKSMQGFYVDGTLTELVVKEQGSSATVSCKVSMLIASFPEKSMFGFLNGGASVTASTSPSDIASASSDCVDAVVDNLVAKKIVPTIRSKAGQ